MTFGSEKEVWRSKIPINYNLALVWAQREPYGWLSHVHQYCFLHFLYCLLHEIFIHKDFPYINQSLLVPRRFFYLVLSLISNTNCRYLVNFSTRVVSMLRCCGRTISHTHIFFCSFSSSIKTGPLAVVVFHRWNSKSHISFTLPFFITVLRSHLSLYQIASLFMNSNSLAHATAIIISALLFLRKYSLLASTLQPATRCSTTSLLLYQSSCYLPSSRFGHLFQHRHDWWCLSTM